MKKYLHYFFATAVVYFSASRAISQTSLAPDQNPNYAASRTKYMQIADSLNEWHSTTQQENYKAIDWLADRKEARADRREFRQQLRMERARRYGYYDNSYYLSNNYQRHYNDNYRYNNYRRNRFHVCPWYGLNFWW